VNGGAAAADVTSSNSAAAATAVPAAALPGSWLGVLGGGQLGRMFSHAAQAMGYRVCVLDPQAGGPAGSVADEQFVAAYDDPAALERLGRLCAGVTTEFENVPAASLDALARYCPVRPGAAPVAITQDRILEKRFVRSCGFEVAPHALIAGPGDLQALDPALFPAILKTARLGYDGKGQAGVAGAAQAADAWRALGSVPCVLEQRLPLRRELSVIVARSAQGATAVYPVCENEHREGILAVTVMPARIDAAQARQASEIARTLAQRLEHVGVLCVELFELGDGRLVVNELAPRPHNSGHATIDACGTSQFAQQVRALAGMPLGEVRLLAPAVMLNLMGECWFASDRTPRPPRFEDLLAIPGAGLHLYGKTDPRAGRKMGHVTLLGTTIEQALDRAALAAACLGLAPGQIVQPRSS
jgi:5-(carboxyamino)imidazole ribonucleotide synthase